jgi:AcrR family transcriptional regulator
LAAIIGVSQPALYRHFASKDELVQEVVVRGWIALERSVEHHALPVDPYERLEQFAIGYIRHAARNKGWFRVTFSAGTLSETTIQAMERQHRDHAGPSAQQQTLLALAAIVPLGSPAYGDTWRAWWGLSHGLASLVVEGVFRLVDDEDARIHAAARSVRVFVDALRAHHGAPGPIPELSLAELFRHLVPRER